MQPDPFDVHFVEHPAPPEGSKLGVVRLARFVARDVLQGRPQPCELRGTKARLEQAAAPRIERIAAEKLADAADLWTGGVTVADVLDDAGDVVDTEVHAAVDGLLEQRPHWAAPKPEPHKRPRGLTSGAGRPRTVPNNWASALRGDGV